MSLPASDRDRAVSTETAPLALSSADTGAPRPPGVWRSNAPFVAAAVLAFVGILRVQLTQRHASTHPGSMRTSLRAQLNAGIARAELAFPAALAPHAPFEIEAPRSALLYSSAQSARALEPVHCNQVSCTYVLSHHAQPDERQIIAQLRSAGDYAFEVVQHTGYGEVHGSVALHVRP